MDIVNTALEETLDAEAAILLLLLLPCVEINSALPHPFFR